MTIPKTVPYLLFLYITTSVLAIPLSFSIPKRQTECLFDRLEQDEYLTLSLFISSGSPLSGRAIIEGPVARSVSGGSADVLESAKALQKDIRDFDSGERFGIDMIGVEKRPHVDKTGTLRYSEHVDFENYDYSGPTEDDDDDDGRGDDDDRIAQRKRKRDRKREIREYKRQQAKKREEGEPFLKTVQILSPGWYRVCFHAVSSEVVVEMDMRKSSDFGPIDPETGHVPSLESFNEKMVEFEIDEDAADESDLDKAREHLKTMNRLLLEIKEKQANEVRRLDLHRELNNHSHSRMVLGSLFETVLFIAVTGFQVYTIRKWFQGGTLLGR